MRGIVWCVHCGCPHNLAATHCRRTGKPLEQRFHERLAPAPAPAVAPAAGPAPERGAKHPLIGKVIDGKYRVLSRLGAGGMGEVFEAENVELHRRVAIKVVWSDGLEEGDDSIARLRREAHVIASIDHPNICTLFEVGSFADGSPYLVLERLYGQTLHAAIRQKPRLSQGAVLEIFRQLLTATHVAHSAGILHRDLKPANVFLVRRAEPTPLVKLLDFGFAKDMSGRFQSMTRPGQTCGTPTYMSPEQLLARPVDASSDLFSVGIMLFEAIAGRHPFQARTVAHTSMNIVQKAAPSLRSLCPGASVQLEEVVHRALEKTPALRYRSALEMQTALMDALDADDMDTGEDSAEVTSRSLLPCVASGLNSGTAPASSGTFTPH